jgi:hypothetical protein
MKSQHIHCKTNTDLEVWIYHHQTSHPLTVLLLYLLPCGWHTQSQQKAMDSYLMFISYALVFCFHTYINFFQIIIPVVDNGRACKQTCICQFTQEDFGCGPTAWQQIPRWNKLLSSNLWLQYSDKCHTSDILHFSDYILHSCQARLCGVSVSAHIVFIWCPFSLQLFAILCI